MESARLRQFSQGNRLRVAAADIVGAIPLMVVSDFLTEIAEVTLQQVQALMQHPAFSLQNPNKVRALIGRFCAGNPVNFHAADGAGYRFLADRVLELDTLNPSIAARLVQTLSRWRRSSERTTSTSPSVSATFTRMVYSPEFLYL